MKSTSPLLLQLEPLDPKQKQYRWLIELGWLALTVLTIVVLFYRFMPELMSHAFFWPVVVGIITTGTYGRYLLNIGITPWARSVVVILLLGLACIPIGVYLYMSFTEFQVYYDDTGFEDLFANRPFAEGNMMKGSLRRLCIFSFIAGLVSIVLYPISGSVYLWRKYKSNA